MSSTCLVSCNGLQSMRDDCYNDPCTVLTHSNSYCCPYSVWRLIVLIGGAIFTAFAIVVCIRQQRRAREAAARNAYQQGMMAGQTYGVYGEPVQGQPATPMYGATAVPTGYSKEAAPGPASSV